MIAPALVRHLVFWPQHIEHERGNADEEARRVASLDPARREIEEYVRRIQRTCSILGSNGSPLGDRPLFGDDKLRHTQFVNVVKHLSDGTSAKSLGLRLRLRFDIHKEYFGITQAVDAIDLTEDSRFEGQVEARKIIGAVQAHDVESREDAQYLYDGFWSALEKATGIGIESFASIKLGEFRGLALPLRYMQPEIVLDRPPARRARAFTGLGRPRIAETDGDSDPIESHEGGLLSDDLVKWVGHSRKFLNHVLFPLHEETSGFASRAADVVMCGMLDGKALYASSLGQGSPAGYLKYLVVYDGKSAEQLGRLMRRLHVLGEMRLAALIDYAELSTASKQIRGIGDAIDAEASRFAQIWNRRRGREVQKQLFEVVQRRIAEYSIRLTQVGRYGAGWLVYRTSRSKYYAEAYRERLRDLRVVRIEGWQPYDEFVRRYLFQFFDDIARIGERYESLSRRLNRYVEIAQTEQIRLNEAAVNRHTELTTKLLSIGDVVGTAAFSYYGGQVFYSLLKVGLKSFDVKLQPENDDTVKLVGYLLAFLLFQFILKPWWARGSDKETGSRSKTRIEPLASGSRVDGLD